MIYQEGVGAFRGQTGCYELWDSESGNLIAELDSEVEALAAVHRAALLHGAAALQRLSLLRCSGEGSTVVARGSQLATLRA